MFVLHTLLGIGVDLLERLTKFTRHVDCLMLPTFVKTGETISWKKGSSMLTWIT
jgi:hypothetical protein